MANLAMRSAFVLLAVFLVAFHPIAILARDENAQDEFVYETELETSDEAYDDETFNAELANSVQVELEPSTEREHVHLTREAISPKPKSSISPKAKVWPSPKPSISPKAKVWPSPKAKVWPSPKPSISPKAKVWPSPKPSISPKAKVWPSSKPSPK
eukprot:CAMPEP_0184673740 /NCGR_PEP_ID=MMETSP0308-20130426/86845_1 /TAXON_ID=38269 /ORGANISM="Gloeochaete witrockiana, Strain SAG 46.84" /LENGTH=155 /DNA_ID=CAMNT_0027121259 /DNA_START=298 /DNA_END=765 /DNA_ORIENTATION=-